MSFPEKDILHSHKDNLQQRHRSVFFLVKHKLKRKSLLVINQPACILSWCFSFPCEGNSLAQPLKVQLKQKKKYKGWGLTWPKTDQNDSYSCVRCAAAHWNGRICWCSHMWAFSWFLLLKSFPQPLWSHWKRIRAKPSQYIITVDPNLLMTK